MSFEPEHLTVLRALGNLQTDGTADRRNLRLASEHRGRDGHSDVRVQIVSLPLEHCVRTNPDAQIQVAGDTAVRSRFAFACGADARAVLDADRNANVDRTGVPALFDRHPAGRPVERFVERQVDLVLDVATLLNPRRATGPLPSAGARSAAEERLEEIGERVLVAEEIPHLLFGHGPVTTGAARVGRVG